MYSLFYDWLLIVGLWYGLWFQETNFSKHAIATNVLMEVTGSLFDHQMGGVFCINWLTHVMLLA